MMISASGSVSIAVMAGEGHFSFDKRYYFDPEVRWEQDKRIALWCEKKFQPYPVYNAEAHLARAAFQPRPFRQVGGLQPNLILAAALGAGLLLPGNRDPDVDGAPLNGISNYIDMMNLSWEEQEPVKTFLNQVDDLRERYHDQAVDIIPPFFWDCSGRAAIHGPLTTAVKLLGEEFFTLPFTRFEDARRLITWITENYLDLARIFAARAGIQFNEIHVGECTGSLFPAEMWESLVIPAVNRLGRAVGRVRLHSCGKSDYLLDVMKKVDHLHCLNIGSNTSLKKTREVFGKEIRIDIIPDTRLLQDGSSAEISKWVRNCLVENDDGPLEIQFHLDAGMPFENVKTIFTTLEAEGFPVKAESLRRRWRISL